MNVFPAFAIFGFGFLVIFIAVALTVILGGISRRGDKRVLTEGRATPEQRLPTDREREAHGY